jgi:kynurenine formamidase
MARKLIDISVPLQNDVPADPPGGHPTIQYVDHQQGLPRMLEFFAGLKAEDLPDGQGWAVEMVQLSTHNGTHLDAPWHFHPTMNRGERSWTIDEVPLEWCLQPGVKLDFRHLPDGYVATARDVETELKRIGHTLSPLEIVVVNTSAGVKYGRQDYVISGCGNGLRGDDVSLGARRAADRHRRLELGRAVRLYREEIRRNQGRQPDLGRPQGRPPYRLLPHRKASQPRATAVDRFHRVVLSGQDRTRLGGLDLRGRHHRRIRLRLDTTILRFRV